MPIALWEALLLSSRHELFQLQRGGIGVKNSLVIAEQSMGWAMEGEWVFSEHLVCSQPYAKFWEGVPRSKDPVFFFPEGL